MSFRFIRDNQESYFSPVNTAIEVCISKVLYKIKILQKDFIFFQKIKKILKVDIF